MCVVAIFCPLPSIKKLKAEEPGCHSIWWINKRMSFSGHTPNDLNERRYDWLNLFTRFFSALYDEAERDLSRYLRRLSEDNRPRKRDFFRVARRFIFVGLFPCKKKLIILFVFLNFLKFKFNVNFLSNVEGFYREQRWNPSDSMRHSSPR